MKYFLIASAAALALAGAGAAFAQAAPQSLSPPMSMPMKHARMAHPETRAEVQAHVQAMFARLDTNHDGFIDKTEVEAAGTHMHGRTGAGMAGTQGAAPSRGGAFDRLDANHDGNISRAEFDAAMNGRGMKMHHAGMMHMGGKMFDRADLNKDGRLSLAEAQQAALARFDRMDLNHDGTVTPEERQQAHQMRMQRKPA
jgi:Ca2+-binding EF-hand superfamily protein